MDVRDVAELVVWSGLVVTRTVARAAGAMLELLFLVAAWVALLVVGAAMAFQRGGLPWTDRSDPRATARSADSRARRARRR